MRVGVVRGGRGLEREVSLRSGFHVAGALSELGHEPIEMDVDQNLADHMAGVDMVFIALHGKDGEDGAIQSLCEALDVVYTGSTSHVCRTCFEKPSAKQVLEHAGIAVPQGFTLGIEAVRDMGGRRALAAGAERLGYPLVVKPNAQGSALGFAVVADASELAHAAMNAFSYGDRIMVEEFVDGPEFSVLVSGPNCDASTPIEIRTPSGVFDFEARPPSPLASFSCAGDHAMSTVVRAAAQNAATSLGVRDFGRVDLRVSGNVPVVFDVNTCPGLAETSIVPKAVECDSKQFRTFIEAVLGYAVDRRRPGA